MRVVAYTLHNTTHEFPARDGNHAREIAKRIITEGLWLVERATNLTIASETYYPVTQVFKVKIVFGD